MRALVRRFPFATFLLIAFGWTWPLAAGIRFSMILPLLALFGPLLGAVAVFGATEGREGLAGLWRKFAFRRGHLPWLAVAVALPLFLTIPVWWLERMFGSAAAFALTPISALSLVLAFLIIGEEVGWRGFALPYLLGRWPAFRSGVVLGGIWALWHLPNFFLPGFPHQDLPFTAFVLMIVSFSILFTWLYLRTQGSLLVAVVFHAALNLFSVAALDPSRQYWWRALVYGVVALGVVMGGGLRAATPGAAQQRPAL